MANYNGHATVTYCECAESDRSLEELGHKAEYGFSVAQLVDAKARFEMQGLHCELVDLSHPAGGEAAVLVIRNAVPILCKCSQEQVMHEITQLPFDTQMFHYGKLTNKRARHCNVMADFDQAPNYKEKKSTVVSFEHAPSLQRLREAWPLFVGSDAANMLAEINKYPSKGINGVVSGGIGLHGDAERRRVIAVRLGQTAFPLVYFWYHHNKVASAPIEIELNPGDAYIMSDKAVGHDWKYSSIYTLRHAAGSKTYTKPSAKALADHFR